MFKRNAMGNTRAKLVAGAVLMTLGLMGAGSAMSTNVFGGGATLPAGGYVGFNFASTSPTKIFSTNVSTQTGAAVATDSLFGVWAANNSNAVAYCQTGSGNGKKIFDHYDGTTTLVGATGACTGSTSGFGALSAPVDPHFAGSDAPMSQDEFNWFGLGGKTAANGQPVQFPSVVGSVAIAFNNPDVPASGLNLSDAGLCRIFSGQISDWNQLTTAETGLTSTLPSRALKVAFRSDGSGTTFSFANHLSTVCAAGATGQVFQTDQAFTTVVAQYLSAIPSTWLGASGNPGVVTAINNNPGAIGYAESANLKSTPTATNTKVAKVNGFDPYANLPATLTFNSVLLDNVIVGRNANGTPHVQKMSPAAPVANCVLMVNPADYANVSGQYPIIAVSNLIANNKGNGADLTAVRSLFSWLYNSTHTGVNTIGKGADGTGTGFAFVASTVANARVNACINS